jgi:rhodanese-related sulfurtransferase
MTIEPLKPLKNLSLKSVKEEARTEKILSRKNLKNSNHKRKKNNFLRIFFLISKIFSFYFSRLSRLFINNSNLNKPNRKNKDQKHGNKKYDVVAILSGSKGYKKITAKALLSGLSSIDKYCIVDLRSLDDFFKDHIIIDRTGISMNIPFDDFNKRIKDIDRFKLKKLLLYSYNDYESENIAKELSKKGFDVTVLIGGYEAYKKEMFEI